MEALQVLDLAMRHTRISNHIWRFRLLPMTTEKCCLALAMGRTLMAVMPKSSWDHVIAKRACHSGRGSCISTSPQAVTKPMYHSTAVLFLIACQNHLLICVAIPPFWVCHKGTTSTNWAFQGNRAASLVHSSHLQLSINCTSIPISIWLPNSTTTSTPQTPSYTTSTTTQPYQQASLHSCSPSSTARRAPKPTRCR